MIKMLCRPIHFIHLCKFYYWPSLTDVVWCHCVIQAPHCTKYTETFVWLEIVHIHILMLNSVVGSHISYTHTHLPSFYPQCTWCLVPGFQNGQLPWPVLGGDRDQETRKWIKERRQRVITDRTKHVHFWHHHHCHGNARALDPHTHTHLLIKDRKSTRLNSCHL